MKRLRIVPKRWKTRNSAPCVRCDQTIWFGGYAPEHARCIVARLRDDDERRRARLIAEELHRIASKPRSSTERQVGS